MDSSPQPPALAPGTRVAEAFQVVRVLGRGGFGITYLATDLARGDKVALKELAPAGTHRSPGGGLSLQGAEKLRGRFMQEAKLLAGLAIPGVPQCRSVLAANGTAYAALEYIADASPLSERLGAPCDETFARQVFDQLLAIVQQLHQRGVLHLDIKPANVLLRPDGRLALVDFGSARQWYAEATGRQTALHTPGYAPIEQMSERAPRGPASDVYGLCATVYALLTGAPPPSAADRAAGIPLAELPTRSGLAAAVMAGLRFGYSERPTTALELRKLADREPEPEPGEPRALHLAAAKTRLRKFRAQPRQCPGCGKVLEAPTPLAKGRCPACQQGILRQRKFHDRLCPLCRSGVLSRVEFAGNYCPSCGTGRLARKGGLLPTQRVWHCQACPSTFAWEKGGLRSGDRCLTWADWQTLHGRPAWVWRCDTCPGLFAEEQDGRRRRLLPAAGPGDWLSLYPEEWARVAAGLDPGAGDLQCSACRADFDLDGEHITLLGAPGAPASKFVDDYAGRRLALADLPWVAVGKHSGAPGPLCVACGTEFDQAGDELVLVRSTHRRLADHLGEAYTATDWHRIAQDLPLLGEEQGLDEALDDALREAFVLGDLAFDGKDEQVLWRGPATNAGMSGTLTVTPEEAVLQRLLAKARWPLAEVRRFRADGDTLLLDDLAFDLEPVRLTYGLGEERVEVELGAPDLAARLRSLRASGA